ncbi:MAG: CitMHS family transporter [Bilifractor sp.]|jgi:CitMHS family citrate-Mg2+:H+ or citrate-Ca2+:H+ symporter
MKAIIGLIIIVVMLVLLMTKKTSVHFTLVIVPCIGALLLGTNLTDLGTYIGDGLVKVANTGIMLMFAALFFSIMFDAGLFDPLIRRVIKMANGDPLKILIGTTAIAMCAHLDGSGASTYLIVVSAMLPVFEAVKMRKIYLALMAGLSAGIINMVPWGGPLLRASVVVDKPVNQLYVHLIPVQIVGIICVFLVAVYFGRKERKRLSYDKSKKLDMTQITMRKAYEGDPDLDPDLLKRPKRIWINLILVVVVIASLIFMDIPLSVPFVIGLPLALIINYPDVKLQKKLLEYHAPSVVYTTSILFCAGVFTGVMSGTGMITAMSEALVDAIPQSLGKYFAKILAFLSFPSNFLFDTDSFYYGVLPILLETAEKFGVSGTSMVYAAMMGHSTICSACSPLIGSAWLLVGLVDIDFGDLQKVIIPIAWGISLVMIFTSMAIGLF